MKKTVLIPILVCGLTLSPLALAQTEDTTAVPVETQAPAPVSEATDTAPEPIKAAGMHKGEKCKTGGKHAYRSKHGHGHSCKAKHEKHADVVRRLELLDARLAKIEAMLEILMRR